MSAGARGPTSRHAVDPVTDFYDALVGLIAREPFELAELPESLRSEAEKLRRQTDAIEPHPTRSGEYLVDADIREAVEAREPAVQMPCGHTGFRNVRGDGFACRNAPWCEARFDRATVEEVLAES